MSKGCILIVAGGFQVGGTERHLSLVLPELRRRGWDIRVVLLGDDGPMSENIRAAGIPIIQLPSAPITNIPLLRGALRLLGQVLSLSRIMKRTPPDILHAFLPTCCVVACAAAILLQFSPVVMSRRSQSARPSLFFGDKALESWALKCADLVLGHSSEVVRELHEIEGIKLAHTALIHNGIEYFPKPTLHQKRTARTRLKMTSNDFAVICVATLIPYKGHIELLTGVRSYLKKFPARKDTPTVKVFLLGSGESSYVERLTTLSERLGISDNVIFVGAIKDIEMYLLAADLGILCSHHEGFSNALLEYMRAELPVIATRTGGNLDAVEEGITGTLVKVNNSDDIANAIQAHLTDRAKSENMGMAGRKRFEALFTLDACVEKYEATYDTLVKRHYPQ